MRPFLVSARAGIVVVGLAAVQACGGGQRQLGQAERVFVRVDVATVGIGLESGSPVVLLQKPGSDHQMPIWVGPMEAAAIQHSLRGEAPPRPITHDLLATLTQQTGATVEDVRVHHAEGGIYYGVVRLRLRGETGVRELDSRPSDAIALALRVGAPILVRRELLEDAPQITFLPLEVTEQVVRTAGLTVVTPTPELRSLFGLSGDQKGVLVLRAEGVADSAGFRPGDLIVSVDSVSIGSPIDLLGAIQAEDGDSTAMVRYWRGREVGEAKLPRPKRERGEGRVVRT